MLTPIMPKETETQEARVESDPHVDDPVTPTPLNTFQRSELRYRRLFESARDGILILDVTSGAITDANPYLTELLGYSHEELLNKELWEIGLFADQEASRNAVRTLQKDGYLRYDNLPLETRDGERRDVEVVSNVYGEGDQNVIQCNIRDITLRMRAEEALHLSQIAVQASEERFRALTERSSDVITVIAPSGTVLYESPSAVSVFGYLPNELVGTNAIDLVHPDDRPDVAAAIRSLASGGAFPDRLTHRCRHKNGSWCWVESMVSDQVDNPAIGGLVLNSRDVTERVRFQQQILQTEKLAALGELVAGVAHELNNPLAAISGHAQLLKKHPDPLVKEDAEAVDQMVQRAARIVRSLRSYTHISREDLRKETRLNEVMTSALAVVSYMLRKAGVTVTLHLETDLPPVLLNPGEMEQVIINLLSNAEYALRDKPEAERVIRLTTRCREAEDSAEQQWCVTEVQDKGAGMSEAVRGRIFDPFFTTKDVGQGTGLGLYISHGIVTAHGGTIEAQSRDGEGTTLIISLPAAGSAADGTEKEKP